MSSLVNTLVFIKFNTVVKYSYLMAYYPVGLEIILKKIENRKAHLNLNCTKIHSFVSLCIVVLCSYELYAHTRTF